MYEAIMKAAGMIKRRPNDFHFFTTEVPDGECGSPGCALGWIGHFAGGARWFIDVPEMLGLGYGGEFEFYSRMDRLVKSVEWRYEAGLCATALRLYAEKYHGDEKPKVKTGVHPFVQKLLEQPSRCSV